MNPGAVITRQGAITWLVYQIIEDGQVDEVAAAYHNGQLIRRDVVGWWTAAFNGSRNSLAASLIAGTWLPEGWRIHPEQTFLADFT